MKKPIFIQNTPIDEKRISFIERIVSRLAMSIGESGNIKVITTPYPISNCVVGDDVSGPVLRYMFCASGHISSYMIHLGKAPKGGANISLLIESGEASVNNSFIMSTRQIQSKISTRVNSGDRITVSIDPIDKKFPITEVWISFLWTPLLKETSIKSFLIEDLEI